MFNTNSYKAGDTNLKINACSGGIYKTYRESWFKRFEVGSPLAKVLFRKEKCFYNIRSNEYSSDIYKLEDKFYTDNGRIKEVIILQMIICGEGEVIAELILKEDFDKYFEKEKVEE